MSDYRMLIDGELVQSVSRRTFVDIDPATEEPLAVVPDGTAEDTTTAIDAAARARSGWRERSPLERAECCLALADALEECADELGELESRDTGSCLAPMRNDVRAGARSLRYFAGLALELKGMTVPVTQHGFHFTIREPFGVVGKIIPFNHPIMFGASKLGAPLVAGNTVVLKPPPQAPLTNLVMGELAQRLFPPGVLNIVIGAGPDVGQPLVKDHRVRRLGLTGSVPTGKVIVRESADHLPVITLELGGKNPLIVFPDADLDEAARGAIRSMNFGWQGQSCGSTSRVMVHRSIEEEFTERLLGHVAQLRQGSPLDPATQVGALISKQHYERVLEYIEIGKKEGATLRAGGGRPEGPGFERGFFVAPTVFTGVTREMTIANDEIFGPVMALMSWEDENEMLEIANSVPLGLTANVFTNDLRTVLRVVPRIEAGFVWVNGLGQHFQGLPYGGHKESGLGDEEGLEELLSYTQVKSVSLMDLGRTL